MARHRRSSCVAVVAVLAALLVAVPTAFAARGERHDFKRQVELLEEQWRQAQLTGDIAAMDRLLSDDFVGITMTGQVNTKVQQLNRARTHALVLTRLDLDDVKVKLIGQVAIVTVKASVDGISDSVPITGEFRYTRVYQHQPTGGWKITNFEATRVPAHRRSGETVAVDRRKPG